MLPQGGSRHGVATGTVRRENNQEITVIANLSMRYGCRRDPSPALATANHPLDVDLKLISTLPARERIGALDGRLVERFDSPDHGNILASELQVSRGLLRHTSRYEAEQKKRRL